MRSTRLRAAAVRIQASVRVPLRMKYSERRYAAMNSDGDAGRRSSCWCVPRIACTKSVGRRSMLVADARGSAYRATAGVVKTIGRACLGGSKAKRAKRLAKKRLDSAIGEPNHRPESRARCSRRTRRRRGRSTAPRAAPRAGRRTGRGVDRIRSAARLGLTTASFFATLQNGRGYRGGSNWWRRADFER